MLLVNIIGVIGVTIIVSAYFLLQLDRINSKGFWYSFLNAFGSLMIIYSVFYNWNLASFVIEFFWILISIYGLWKYYILKYRNKRN